MANSLSPETLAALQAKFGQVAPVVPMSQAQVPNANPAAVIPGGIPAPRPVPQMTPALVKFTPKPQAPPAGLPAPQANTSQIAPTGDTSFDRFVSYSNSGIPLGGAAQ